MAPQFAPLKLNYRGEPEPECDSVGAWWQRVAKLAANWTKASIRLIGHTHLATKRGVRRTAYTVGSLVGTPVYRGIMRLGYRFRFRLAPRGGCFVSFSSATRQPPRYTLRLVMIHTRREPPSNRGTDGNSPSRRRSRRGQRPAQGLGWTINRGWLKLPHNSFGNCLVDIWLPQGFEDTVHATGS